jgi:hypothetical protein
MNALTTWTRRSVLPAVSVAALAAVLAGCHGSGAVAGGASAPGTTPAAATAPASSAASSPASAPSTARARVVYLTGGGSVTGTRWHEPGCNPDCVLSGDGTLALRGMTWQSWGTTRATGTGTAVLDNCTPNCASGKPYAVPATVTLSRPVMVCVGGTGQWFWTRTSFTWTKGLPAVFSGDNAPANPFNYDGLASQAATTC